MKTSIKVLLLVLLAVFFCQAAMGQHLYTGTVIDNSTREPLECACIRCNGKMCCTDKAGHFRISLPTDTATLTITYIGYATGTLPVKDRTTPIQVMLNPGQIDLKQVTITPSLTAASFHILST
ncbi:MAG: carboxypeptidase-like regulatory domain-containing protein, partial [Bacteroidetes bacterium]|nr:carboxypeptidase-like regulatory domain-containing protein [Bacteroidota bacterium]